MPLSITEKVLHPFGFQPPFGDQAVSGQATLEGRSSDARLIDAVTARDYAQFFDIQIGIFYFQRIKGPLDQLETARDGVLALKQLDAAAKPGIAVPLANRHNERMQIGMAAPGPADGKAESDAFVAVEAAADLSTAF